MEKERDHKFNITWVIEHISNICHESKVESLRSLDFVSNSLPGMKFHLEVFAQGNYEQNHIRVCITRDDNISEVCTMKYGVEALDFDGTIYRSIPDEVEVDNSNGLRFLCVFERYPPFRSSEHDILVIKCTFQPVGDSDKEEKLPELSYRNELFTDVVLRTGDSTFRVHKAILSARWPKLVEALQVAETCEQILDVKPDVLQAMLEHVYTGKLDCSKPEILANLHPAKIEYGLPNLECTPYLDQKIRTRITTEKISFEWPIKNFSKLSINTVLYSRVFSINILGSCLWNLEFHMGKQGICGRIFDVFICKICDTESQRIFVKSKIFYDDTYAAEKKCMFERKEKWKCAEFCRYNCGKPKDDVLLLKCEFEFSDGCYSSEIVESSPAFVSFINCHSFKNDFQNLYRNGTLSDVNIVAGSKIFPAHKCILSARSPVFSRMFMTVMSESKKNIVEITDTSPDIMDDLLLYMYSGCLKNTLDETVEELYAAADNYDIQALKRKCSSYLKSIYLDTTTVRNVLQLAVLHSDDDLYQSVLEFIDKHAEDVFSSLEWKEFVENNTAAKVLQDLVNKRKQGRKIFVIVPVKR